MKTIKLILFGLILTGGHSIVHAQDSDEAKDVEAEINYLWIDTIIKRSGNEVRMVSSEMVEATCCLKSPKYRRTSNKAVKWIRKNYDPTYEINQSPFKTLQNHDLVNTVIENAKEKAKSDSTILLVDYVFKCEK